MPQNKPVLVTGASGFIGRHLVNRLNREHVSVRALVLPEETTDGLWCSDIEVVRGDISDPDAVTRAMDGAGTVFHLAALVSDWDPDRLHDRVTVGGTEHVLDAALQNDARVLLASSIVVYGDRLGRDNCDEDHAFGAPAGAYSNAKQRQELLARRHAERTGLPLTVIRPSNVIGPGCGPWVEEAVEALRQGAPALIGGGDHNAGLCSVDNAVDIFIRAWRTEGSIGGTYNAADGSDITWRQYFTDLAKIAGTSPPRNVPRWLAAILAVACERAWSLAGRPERPPITREALNLVGSHHRIPIDRARRELGYEPRPDSYESTLRAIAASID